MRHRLQGVSSTRQEIQKDWPALDDDFRSFPLIPATTEAVFQQFTS